MLRALGNRLARRQHPATLGRHEILVWWGDRRREPKSPNSYGSGTPDNSIILITPYDSDGSTLEGGDWKCSSMIQEWQYEQRWERCEYDCQGKLVSSQDNKFDHAECQQSEKEGRNIESVSENPIHQHSHVAPLCQGLPRNISTWHDTLPRPYTSPTLYGSGERYLAQYYVPFEDHTLALPRP